MNPDNFKKLAIIDFDETLIKGQSQKLFLKFFLKEGHLGLFKYLILSLWFILFKFNLFRDIKPILEFATSSIAGKKVIEINQVFEDFFNSICIPLIYKNSRELVEYLKNNGFQTLLMSSAIDGIVLEAQKYFGIDKVICTQLEVLEDCYTGRIRGEPIFAQNKLEALQSFIKFNNIRFEKIYAFADHPTDIPLLSSVSNPIAVNPSGELWKHAKKENWPMLYLDDNESFQYFKSNTML